MKRYKPVIDYEKLDGSENDIIDICPVSVFELKDDKLIVANDVCIGCRTCENLYGHSIKVIEVKDV